MKNIIRWFFGLVFLLGSLIYSSMLVPIAGLFMFLVSVILIPPFDSFVSNRIGLKLSTKWKVILCIIFIFIGVGVYSNSDAYKKVQEENAYDKTHPTATAIPTIKPTTKPTIKPTAKSLIITATLPPAKPTAQIVKENSNDITPNSIKSIVIKLENAGLGVVGENDFKKVEVVGDMGNIKDGEIEPSTKIVTVYYKPKSVWDEKHMVKMACRTTTAVAEALFTNAKISTVRVLFLNDFTDSYGKTNEEKAVQIDMSRETANKINWSKFKELVLDDYMNLLNVADSSYIHPAIRKFL